MRVMRVLQPKWIEESVILGNKFHVRRKNPLVHNSINLTVMILMLAGIGLIAYLSTVITALLYIPVASLVLAFSFFALSILVIHEASHNMFVVFKDWSKTTRWNERFGWAVSILFGINFRDHWQRGHLLHHNHPMEPDDPQICNPRIGRELFKRAIQFLINPKYIYDTTIRGAGSEYDCPAVLRYPSNWKGMSTCFAIWILVSILSLLYLSWSLLVVAYIALRVFAIMAIIKSALEHGGEMAYEKNPYLRQRTSVFPLKYLLLPMNISYHFEHHLNYFVPWYDLGRYHRELLRIIPAELHPYIFNQDAWHQLTGKKPAFISSLRPLLESNVPSPAMSK